MDDREAGTLIDFFTGLYSDELGYIAKDDPNFDTSDLEQVERYQKSRVFDTLLSLAKDQGAFNQTIEGSATYDLVHTTYTDNESGETRRWTPFDPDNLTPERLHEILTAPNWKSLNNGDDIYWSSLGFKDNEEFNLHREALITAIYRDMSNWMTNELSVSSLGADQIDGLVDELIKPLVSSMVGSDPNKVDAVIEQFKSNLQTSDLS